MSAPRLLVTAATGQLGRLVIAKLLETVPADRVVAGVRDPAKAADLAARGVHVRVADYDRPDTLDAAFAGVGRAVLISGTDFGRRAAQHGNAIAAAKRAGVGLLAYTSLLHAATSPLTMLAAEHRQTEAALTASGVPFALLRNGWYTENHLMALPQVLAHGAVIGSAADGRFSAAARADYAAAAAAVLTGDGHAGQTYELAGDASYTLADLAAEIARRSGKAVVYKDLPAAAYAAVLTAAGLPPAVADVLADSDVGASRGGLFDESHQLSRLIGRPTTPWAQTVAAAF